VIGSAAAISDQKCSFNHDPHLNVIQFMNAGLVEMFKFFNITARNPATNCNRSQTNKLT
jgi:hypothetical protein